MRRALVLFVIVFAACAAERKLGNVQIVAPLQLQGASVAVDGQQPAALQTPNDPLLEMMRQFLGRKRTCFVGFAEVPNGAHTLRIVKQGFAPIERTVDVADRAVVQVCAADVRPLK